MSFIRPFIPIVRMHLPLLMFVMTLFIMGLVFGFLLVMALSVDQHQQLSRYVSSFLRLAVQGQISDIQLGFWQAYFVHLKWLALIWLMGITVIGLPLVAILDFLKGTLIGFTVGFLSTQMSWKGFLLALGSVLPGNLFSVPAILIASSASISFAFFFVKSKMTETVSPFKKPFLTYTALMLLLSLVMAFAALVEVYLTPHFLKWFADFIV
jgi:stage II sporulation protein M